MRSCYLMGSPFYDKEDGVKGIATDEDSVEVVTSYGTGFFISEDGKIATNAHVVSNMVSDKDVKNSVSSLISALKKCFLLCIMRQKKNMRKQ